MERETQHITRMTWLVDALLTSKHLDQHKECSVSIDDKLTKDDASASITQQQPHLRENNTILHNPTTTTRQQIHYVICVRERVLITDITGVVLSQTIQSIKNRRNYGWFWIESKPPGGFTETNAQYQQQRRKERHTCMITADATSNTKCRRLTLSCPKQQRSWPYSQKS